MKIQNKLVRTIAWGLAGVIWAFSTLYTILMFIVITTPSNDGCTLPPGAIEIDCAAPGQNVSASDIISSPWFWLCLIITLLLSYIFIRKLVKKLSKKAKK